VAVPKLSRRTGIALLAKAPVPGKVKTRFCPPCTPEEAARFAEAFLLDTAETMNDVAVSERVHGWCSYLGDSNRLNEIFGGRMLLQRGNDFSERIANATEDLFDMGYESTMAFAADCPTVDVAYLDASLQLLTANDVVFGPALDGGCVLVGLSKRAPEIFRDVEMSTDHVLTDMKQVADRLGLHHVTMEMRHDLDTVADLIEANESGEIDHARHTRALMSRLDFDRLVRQTPKTNQVSVSIHTTASTQGMDVV
jgi:rSAM/selenodomain-associated transferase 1